jgi:hypothetical protein
MADEKIKIWKPFKGFQEKFISSNVDFLVAGSAMGVGKSYAALLMAAAHQEDPNFRMVYLRRNIGDLKAGGGGTDEAQKLYNGLATFKISESPRMTFPSGAFVDFTHMSDQTPDKVLERIKGWQYSCIYIDEATGFEWSTVRLLMSRNRSQAKWTGKMRLTSNPKRNHWLRTWVDWYLDARGYPIPERVGVVRYFFVNGENIEDVIFGDTPEAVYNQCRGTIDSILKTQGDDYTYKDLIKSTTFYTGKLSDNKALMANDSGYLGSVAAMGEKQRQANMDACWNVDLDEDIELPIQPADARRVVRNDEQTNGTYWLSADLADIGTDRLIAIVWNGFHMVELKSLGKSTPKQNADFLLRIATKYNIPDNHIIYDANRAPYMLDYIPNALGFISTYAPRGKYRRDFQLIKDEVYMRFVIAIREGRVSMSEEVAKMNYAHEKLSTQITVLEEFIEECGVVQFYETPNGKKRLFTKKDMNSKLGKSRSMDILDAVAMRFFPVLQAEYGQELEYGVEKNHLYEMEDSEYCNIYDEATWA